MSVNNIIEVQTILEGDNYDYVAYTKNICYGNVKVVLSSANSTQESYRLDAKSFWEGTYGKATVKMSLLEDKTDLYVYLLDEDLGVTSSVIRVFVAPLSLKRWALENEDALVLYPVRNSDDFQISSKLRIKYKDSRSMGIIRDIPLPQSKISFLELDIWRDTKQFEFALGYFMVNGGAEVYGASSEKITAYIAPPIVTGITLSQNKVIMEGSFISGVEVYADLLLEGLGLKTYQLSASHDFEAADVVWDPSCDYTVCLYYKTSLGMSRKGDAYPLVTLVPEVVSCEYTDAGAVISLADHGVYEVVYGNASVTVTGQCVTVPKETKKVKLRAVKGFTKGREVEYSLSCPAYYSLKAGNDTFFAMQDGPDGLKVNEDIDVLLDGLPPTTKPYEGVYFTLSVEGEKANLTIGKEVYTEASHLVQEDYSVMLTNYNEDNQAILILKNAIKAYLPMRAEDFPFYYYDCNMADGYTGITEGMSLFTEYTLYQSIPDDNASNASLPDSNASYADLSGFTGTGTARYQVVEREKKIKVEPFASAVNFTVNPPSAIQSDNKLCGGAGVADLLYTGFAAAYVRLVYPVKFTDRTGVGDLVYTNNVCLITSNSWEALVDATVNMRRGALSVPGVAYNFFRGRSVVLPQIRITVNGNEEWASLGTTLQDVMDMHGLRNEKPILKRRSEKGARRFYYTDTDTPLVIGDVIEVSV